MRQFAYIGLFALTIGCASGRSAVRPAEGDDWTAATRYTSDTPWPAFFAVGYCTRLGNSKLTEATAVSRAREHLSRIWSVFFQNLSDRVRKQAAESARNNVQPYAPVPSPLLLERVELVDRQKNENGDVHVRLRLPLASARAVGTKVGTAAEVLEALEPAFSDTHAMPDWIHDPSGLREASARRFAANGDDADDKLSEAEASTALLEQLRKFSKRLEVNAQKAAPGPPNLNWLPTEAIKRARRLQRHVTPTGRVYVRLGIDLAKILEVVEKRPALTTSTKNSIVEVANDTFDSLRS